ncbi:Wzz/FepE/Etk N-terminal domain-containing protein [Duganella sp. FT27W]|uniref:GumC family protein n=1 Tax=Duganella sp. FT27W TaxID=2654636 RepID=UPI00128C301B|nr:Wzz/FepE/Etk N-terminal domain-containing protein [Duganella sp. FT27W]MPQ57142.1 hypothetical protein [Duganella sp. FT27W]
MFEGKQEERLSDDSGNQILLSDLVKAIAIRKRLIVGLPLFFAIIALIAVIVIKPYYTSTATIMPPQQQGSGMAAMLGQLGGGLAAAASLGAIKNPNDLYVGMLSSRTVADALIDKFKLRDRYDEETTDGAREKLKRVSAIVSGKDGLIAIAVEDRDPKFAADMANAYVVELGKLNQSLALTEAAKRRLFFETQLKQAKDQLAEAEIRMRDMQQKTGMIQLDGQVKGIIAGAAQLQAQIAAKEVQLSAMRSFATANNPEMLRLQQELKGLNAQLAKTQTGSANGGLMVPTKELPEVGVEYIRAVRDLKYNETVFELLAKQFELAKIDEAKESSLIQQLDVALPAEKKTGPKRGLIVVGALFVGLILAVLIALVLAFSTASTNGRSSLWRVFANAWTTGK